MNKWLQNNRHKKWFSLLLVGVLLILIGLNLGLRLLFQDKAVYPDISYEGLYTPTPTLMALCEALEGEVDILFCDDPDRLLENTATRYVYILAQKLSVSFPHIRVKTVNIERNPTAVYPYRTTSATEIKADDVIVSSGGRYRILGADSFYTISSEESGDRFWSFNGEYKFATAMLSVTSLKTPYVYFTYGHGESFYVSPTDTKNAHLLSQSQESQRAFYELLQAQGLYVGYLNPDIEDIPSDCVLLVVNSPTEDFTDPDIFAYADNSGTDRMHRYLSERSGAMMLFKDPAYTLPCLEEFAEQWGIRFDNVTIRDNVEHLGSNHILSAVYNTNQDEMSYGVYADMADMPNPPRVVMPNSGAMVTAWDTTHESATSTTTNIEAWYSPFLSSSQNALAFTPAGELAYEKAQSFTLAALSVRIRTDSITTDSHYSYMFASACPDMLSSDYVGESSFGNYDMLFALVRTISRSDVYASMDLGGMSLNSAHLGGKQIIYSDLYTEDEVLYENGQAKRIFHAMRPVMQYVWSAVVVLVPTLSICIYGMVVYFRRRYHT